MINNYKFSFILIRVKYFYFRKRKTYLFLSLFIVTYQSFECVLIDIKNNEISGNQGVILRIKQKLILINFIIDKFKYIYMENKDYQFYPYIPPGDN